MGIRHHLTWIAIAVLILAGTATNRDTEADELVAQDVAAAPADAARLAQAERVCHPATEACQP